MPVFDIGLEQVSLSYATKNICDNVTVGVNEGDRIGIVGRNGDGKTTVLHLLSGSQQPDSGRVSARNGLSLGILEQYDSLDDNDTVQQAALGGQEEYEWASRQRTREIVETLLSGIGLDSRIGSLSGGQRRRVDLARLLLAVRGLLRSGLSCLLAGHLAVAGALRRHRLGGRMPVLRLTVALLRMGCTWVGLLLWSRLCLHRVPGHLGVFLLMGHSSGLRGLGGSQLPAQLLGNQVGEVLGQDVVDEGDEEYEDCDGDDEDPERSPRSARHIGVEEDKDEDVQNDADDHCDPEQRVEQTGTDRDLVLGGLVVAGGSGVLGDLRCAHERRPFLRLGSW